MNIRKLLFSLIRSELKGTEFFTEDKDIICKDKLIELYSISAKHDLAHFLGHTLAKAGLLDNNKMLGSFKNARLMAIYRYEQSRYELNRICKTLNDAQISFVPLKGAVIRNYYSEPWLRTSCDIDVLVREEDLKQAVKVLVSELHYVVDEKNIIMMFHYFLRKVFTWNCILIFKKILNHWTEY